MGFLKHVLLGCLLSLVLGASSVYAGKFLPYSQERIDELEKKYFSRGKVDSEKVDRISAQLEIQRENIFQDLVQYYKVEKNHSEEKARKKASDASEVWVFDYLLLIVIRDLRAAETYEMAMRLAHQLEVVWDATRVEGRMAALPKAIKEVKAVFKTHVAKKRTQAADEAANLFDPATGLFLDRLEVAGQLAGGRDVSQFNPDPRSPFWRNPGDISAIDIQEYYLSNRAPMFEGAPNVFPAINEAVFDEVRTTQSHPKLDLQFEDAQGDKQKLKIKFGPEIHAQPMVSALSMALGFHSDVVKHVKDFRVDMNGASVSQMMIQWGQYFIPKKPGRDFTVERFLRYSDEDQLIFKEGAITARPKELTRVGGWAFDSQGHDELREVRAMHLFNMWVSNSDAKGFGNNKLVIKKTADGKFETYQLQHDLGHSMGGVLTEKLNAVPWNMVVDNNKKEVSFTFQSFKEHGAELKLTYSDAKWMARLIAQLTPQQIHDAVSLGGWGEYPAILVEMKLIARRNDLVKAFELEGEELPNGERIALYPVDTNVTMKGGLLRDGKLIYCEDPNLTVDYCHYTSEVWAPYLTMAGRAFAGLARTATEMLDRYEFDSGEFGLDDDVVPSVIYEPEREIKENPRPTGPHDLYLVMDSYKVGFRLSTELLSESVGVPFSAGATLWKRYTIVHPVANLDAAVFAGNFFVDLLMPFKISMGKLPENFVLMREDYVSGRLRLRAVPGNVGPNTDLKYYKIALDRSILVKNNANDAILYEDQSVSNELAWRIYIGLLFAKLPLVRVENSWGSVNGKGYLIDRSAWKSEGEASSLALQKAINMGDYSDLKALIESGETEVIKELDISSHFNAPSAMFSLLGFLSGESTNRTDRLHVEVYDRRDESLWTKDEVQIRSSENFKKAIYDNEVFAVNINAFAGIALDAKGKEIETEPALSPVIKMQMFISDGMANSEEMDVAYKGFINRLGHPNESPMIYQNFREASRNDIWGPVEVLVEQYFYEGAIERLLDLAENDQPLYQALAESFGLKHYEMMAFVSGISESSKVPPGMLEAYGAIDDIVDHIKSAVRGRSSSKQTMRKMVKKRNSHGEYQMNELVYALQDMVYRDEDTLSGNVLAAVNRYLEFKDIFIRAKLAPPLGSENLFPTERPYVGESGERQAFENVFHFLSHDNDPVEMYFAFDWLR